MYTYSASTPEKDLNKRTPSSKNSPMTTMYLKRKYTALYDSTRKLLKMKTWSGERMQSAT